MKLYFDSNVSEQDAQAFLSANILKVEAWVNAHRKIISSVGAFIRKDNIVICFCGDDSDWYVFVVSAQGKINNKDETFEELINNSRHMPIEYDWQDIEETEIPQPQPPPNNPFDGFPFGPGEYVDFTVSPQEVYYEEESN